MDLILIYVFLLILVASPQFLQALQETMSVATHLVSWVASLDLVGFLHKQYLHRQLIVLECILVYVDILVTFTVFLVMSASFLYLMFYFLHK